jgi:hypothetical protein
MKSSMAWGVSVGISDVMLTIRRSWPSSTSFVTPAAIDDFIEETISRGVELSYPLIREEDLQREYPNSQRTYVKLKDGKVTGGNAAVFGAWHFFPLESFAQNLFDSRKSPIRLLKIVGMSFVVKLLLGRLVPRDVENRLEKLLGFPCAAIYAKHASIGADVDKPADVEIARIALEQAHVASGQASPIQTATAATETAQPSPEASTTKDCQ